MTKYSRSRARPTCSNMPIELMASKGPSRDVAVVLQADLDLVGQALGLDPPAGPPGLLGATP